MQNIAGRGPAVVNNKISVDSETEALPCRAPFKPNSSMSLPADSVWEGFLKMQPALGSFGCDFQRLSLNSAVRWQCLLCARLARNVAPSAIFVSKSGHDRYSAWTCATFQFVRFAGRRSIKRPASPPQKLRCPWPCFMRNARRRCRECFQKFQTGQVQFAGLGQKPH